MYNCFAGNFISKLTGESYIVTERGLHYVIKTVRDVQKKSCLDVKRLDCIISKNGSS